MKKTTEQKAKNIVGNAVRRIRLSQRTPVTQHDLSGRLAARGIKMDQSAIARLEQGARHVFDYEAAAIAKALRVPVEKLYARR